MERLVLVTINEAIMSDLLSKLPPDKRLILETQNQKVERTGSHRLKVVVELEIVEEDDTEILF